MSPRWISLSILVAGLGLACSSDSAPSSDDEDSTSEDEDEDEDEDEGDEEDNSEEGDDDDPLEPARGGIEIETVTVNQGVQVVIADQGEWLGPDQRELGLLNGRRALVRGFWKLPDDWKAREITARLRLEYQGGEVKEMFDTKMIEDEAAVGDLNRTFTFGIEAEDFSAGLKYRMELFEADGGDYEKLDPVETAPANPPEGPELIGVEDVDMRLRVVIVPVHFEFGSCEADSAEILADPEVVERFRDYMFSRNPVQEVDLIVRPAGIDFTNYQDGSGFAPLLHVMQELRILDEAPPNVHYYALLDRCGSGNHDNASGYGYISDMSKSSSNARVSAGVWCPGCGPIFTEYTFVHEVGHSQGMRHVGCGASGHTPHPDGFIGVWGFDVLTYELKNPTLELEYMSYCGTWMSDWTWDFTWNMTRVTTSWENEGPSAYQTPPKGEVMYGLILPNGQERWQSVPGRLPPTNVSAGYEVEFVSAGVVASRAPAEVGEFHDGTRYINFDLPPQIEDIDSMVLVGPQGERKRVPRQQVKRIQAPAR